MPFALRNSIPIGGLLLMSFLWALGVLKGELLPTLQADPLPRMARQALPLALLALATGLLATLLRKRWPQHAQLRNAVCLGLALFVLPEWLSSAADGRVSEPARIVLLTLVPIFTLVFAPYISFLDSDPPRPGTLLAALIPVAGALCVFPAAMPQSIDATIGFLALIAAAAAIAAANCWAVEQMREDLESKLAFVSIASAAAAIALALSSLLFDGPATLRQSLSPITLLPKLKWSITIELPGLILFFWLMTRLSAIRLTTRFLLSPLVAVAGGLLLLHAKPVPRTTAGLIIMAAAAAYLLFPNSSRTESTTLSLH